MPQPQSNQFKLQINLTKAYEENGRAFIEGVASGPKVDLTGERMSPDALKSMVASIEKHIIELRDAHRDEWNDDLGEVISLTLTDDYDLLYKAELDLRLSKAKDLWYRMTEKGKKYGVSIGGAVIKAGMEWAAEVGREVYTYFDVELYEISITRQAAYQHSFASVVTKSMKGTSMPNLKKTVDEAEVVEEVENAEAAEEVVEAPAEGVVQEEATQEEAQEAQEDVAAEDQSDATQTDAEEVEKSEEKAAADEADADEAEVETEEEEEAEGDEPEVEAESDEAEVEKALISAEEVETLRKSLADREAAVAELTKSLSDKEAELAEAVEALEEKVGELETTTEALEAAETELDTIKARKVAALTDAVEKTAVEDETPQWVKDLL